MPTYKKDLTDFEIEQAQQGLMEQLRKGFVKREPLRFETAQKTKPKKRKPKNRGQRKSASDNQGSCVSANQHNGNQTTTTQESNELQAELTSEEQEYMASILEHPNMGVTARREKIFGWSADKGTRLKNGLIDKGLIDEFSVDLGKAFGGRVKMLRLTERGYKALGITPPESLSPRQGSFEHIWWQVQIANDYAQRGYTANIEKVLRSKSADIGVSNGKEWVAVEVELSPRTALSNFRQNIDAGFARTIIACKNAKVKKQVEATLDSFLERNPSYKGKGTVMLLADFPFVKQLHKEIRGL